MVRSPVTQNSNWPFKTKASAQLFTRTEHTKQVFSKFKIFKTKVSAQLFFLHRAHQASIFKYFQNSNFSSLFKTKASAQLFTRTKQVFWSPTTATNQQYPSSSSLTLSSSSEVQLSSQQSAGHRAPDDDEVPVPRRLRQLRVQNLLEKSSQGEIF